MAIGWQVAWFGVIVLAFWLVLWLFVWKPHMREDRKRSEREASDDLGKTGGDWDEMDEFKRSN